MSDTVRHDSRERIIQTVRRAMLGSPTPPKDLEANHEEPHSHIEPPRHLAILGSRHRNDMAARSKDKVRTWLNLKPSSEIAQSPDDMQSPDYAPSSLQLTESPRDSCARAVEDPATPEWTGKMSISYIVHPPTDSCRSEPKSARSDRIAPDDPETVSTKVSSLQSSPTDPTDPSYGWTESNPNYGQKAPGAAEASSTLFGKPNHDPTKRRTGDGEQLSQ